MFEGNASVSYGLHFRLMPRLSLVDEACEVLGLPPGTTDADEVQRVFKKLAVRWHPDKHPDNVQEATARFAEISAARDLLLDPPPAAFHAPPATGAHAASAAADRRATEQRSNELRAFANDVSAAVADCSLPNAAALFAEHKLWAVWVCSTCDLICCRIRKDKYSCLCNHRLGAHDAARGFRCAERGCGCKGFEFQVQTDHEPHKCRCKHAAKDHGPSAPWACKRAGCGCVGFDSPWQCNCGHACGEHRVAYVQQYITPRCREWVTPGLRKETVELANKFRARSPRTRAAFIQRAAAARAAGMPSYKAMHRAARLSAASAEVDASDAVDADATAAAAAATVAAAAAAAAAAPDEASEPEAVRCEECAPAAPSRDGVEDAATAA